LEYVGVLLVHSDVYFDVFWVYSDVFLMYLQYFGRCGFLQVYLARLAPCRAGVADLRAPPLPPTTPWRRACGDSV